MPGDAGVAGARRSLLQFFSGGGGFGGSRGTASLLGTLNAQSAVNAASGSGDPWTTYGATQSASRSAIAGAYGNLGAWPDLCRLRGALPGCAAAQERPRLWLRSQGGNH
jgi:hypothetical protein